MFAWAGNATAPGGFHRIRRLEQPVWVPVEVRAVKGQLSLKFSEALDRGSVDAGAFAVKAWSLKRSANYGSQHLNERSWKVASATLAPDGCTVQLEIPAVGATPC
jgi:hypothetical protein